MIIRTSINEAIQTENVTKWYIEDTGQKMWAMCKRYNIEPSKYKYSVVGEEENRTVTICMYATQDDAIKAFEKIMEALKMEEHYVDIREDEVEL